MAQVTGVLWQIQEIRDNSVSERESSVKMIWSRLFALLLVAATEPQFPTGQERGHTTEVLACTVPIVSLRWWQRARLNFHRPCTLPKLVVHLWSFFLFVPCAKRTESGKNQQSRRQYAERTAPWCTQCQRQRNVNKS